MSFIAPIIVEVSYEEIVNFRSLHHYVKSKAPFMSSKIKMDLK